MTEVTNGSWKGGDPRLMKTADQPRFAKEAPGAVSYAPVTNSDLTLGYVWFDDENDAAYYVAKKTSGSRGNNAGIVWFPGWRKQKRRGFILQKR